MKSFAIIMVAVASLMTTTVHAVDVATPCDETLTETPISFGDIITCNIEVVGDLDKFEFSGTSGDTLRLTLSDVGNGSASMIVEVYDPNFQLIATLSANSSGTFQDLTLMITGIYTMIASEAGNNNTNSYHFALQQIFPAPPTAAVLCLSCAANDENITPVADSDLYLFTADSGDTVRVTLSDIGNGSASMRADIYDPNELLITTLSVASSGIFEDIAILTSGLHTIVVTENGNNNTNPYNLSLNCLFGGCLEPDIAANPLNFDIPNIPSIRRRRLNW